MPLKEFDRAVLVADLPRQHLCAGAVGVVVDVYRGGEAYEVEFFDAHGETLAVETLRGDQLEPYLWPRHQNARLLSPRLLDPADAATFRMTVEGVDAE